MPAEVLAGQSLRVGAEVESFSKLEKVEVGCEDPDKLGEFARAARQAERPAVGVRGRLVGELGEARRGQPHGVGQSAERRRRDDADGGGDRSGPSAAEAGVPQVAKVKITGHVQIGGVSCTSGTVFLDEGKWDGGDQGRRLRVRRHPLGGPPGGYAKGGKGLFHGMLARDRRLPARRPRVVSKDINVPVQ